jgi:hypothetical protein
MAKQYKKKRTGTVADNAWRLWAAGLNPGHAPTRGEQWLAAVLLPAEQDERKAAELSEIAETIGEVF